MVSTFYLAGASPESGVDLETSQLADLDALRQAIAGHFGVVVPEDIGFQSSTETLEDLQSVERQVRESPQRNLHPSINVDYGFNRTD